MVETETNTCALVSRIIAALRKEEPDCRRIIPIVDKLSLKIGRQNLFHRVTSGERLAMINQERCEIRMELDLLRVALSEGDVAKALKHAHAALTIEQAA